MNLIQIKNGQSWAALPCGAVSSAPAKTALDGFYDRLDYASGKFIPVAVLDSVAVQPPIGQRAGSFTVEAEAMRWVLNDAQPRDDKPEFALGWAVGGFLCSTKKGHRMRAVRVQDDGNFMFPAIMARYFAQASGQIVFTWYDNGTVSAIDPLTGRGLWWGVAPHPSADAARKILYEDYSEREEFRSGTSKLVHKNMYFDTALTDDTPDGTATYEARNAVWAVVWHDNGRVTAIAQYKQKEETPHGDE